MNQKDNRKKIKLTLVSRSERSFNRFSHAMNLLKLQLPSPFKLVQGYELNFVQLTNKNNLKRWYFSLNYISCDKKKQYLDQRDVTAQNKNKHSPLLQLPPTPIFFAFEVTRASPPYCMSPTRHQGNKRLLSRPNDVKFFFFSNVM